MGSRYQFTDRIAVVLLIGLLLFGSLTPFFKFFHIRSINSISYLKAETDCLGYYSFLRSAIIDHDLNFDNDYMLFNRPDLVRKKTINQIPENVWTVGPGLLWLPAFLAAHSLSAYLNLLGIAVPTNGLSYIYEVFVVYAAMLYGAIGIFLIYFFLRLSFSSLISFFALIIYFYASSHVFYQFHEPIMSHLSTVFAVSGYIYFWFKHWFTRSLTNWLILGLWAGLIMLMRPQDVFFIIFPVIIEIIFFIKEKKAAFFSTLVGPGLLIITGIICFTPQMIAWKILYNSLLTIPQGPNFMNWTSPQILPLLFSTNHGLITYTPVIAFALLGLFLYQRGNNRQYALFLAFLLIFVAEFYTNSIVWDWWAGWGFGARRFLSCSIIFAWGLGNLLQYIWGRNKSRNFVLGLLGSLIVFNLLFYYQWVYGMIPKGKTTSRYQTLTGHLTWQQYSIDKIKALGYILRGVKPPKQY